MNTFILHVIWMFKFSYLVHFKECELKRHYKWWDRNRKNETLTLIFAKRKKLIYSVCHYMKNTEVKGLKILCHWWLTCKVTCTLAGPVRASAHTFASIETRIWVTWFNSAFLWSPDQFYSVVTVCKRQNSLYSPLCQVLFEQCICSRQQVHSKAVWIWETDNTRKQGLPRLSEKFQFWLYVDIKVVFW
jgi:hypothetical protein